MGALVLHGTQSVVLQERTVFDRLHAGQNRFFRRAISMAMNCAPFSKPVSLVDDRGHFLKRTLGSVDFVSQRENPARGANLDLGPRRV
jgi:hypothetical protein